MAHPGSDTNGEHYDQGIPYGVKGKTPQNIDPTIDNWLRNLLGEGGPLGVLPQSPTLAPTQGSPATGQRLGIQAGRIPEDVNAPSLLQEQGIAPAADSDVSAIGSLRPSVVAPVTPPRQPNVAVTADTTPPVTTGNQAAILADPSQQISGPESPGAKSAAAFLNRFGLETGTAEDTSTTPIPPSPPTAAGALPDIVGENVPYGSPGGAFYHPDKLPNYDPASAPISAAEILPTTPQTPDAVVNEANAILEANPQLFEMQGNDLAWALQDLTEDSVLGRDILLYIHKLVTDQPATPDPAQVLVEEGTPNTPVGTVASPEASEDINIKRPVPIGEGEQGGQSPNSAGRLIKQFGEGLVRELSKLAPKVSAVPLHLGGPLLSKLSQALPGKGTGVGLSDLLKGESGSAEANVPSNVPTAPSVSDNILDNFDDEFYTAPRTAPPLPPGREDQLAAIKGRRDTPINAPALPGSPSDIATAAFAAPDAPGGFDPETGTATLDPNDEAGILALANALADATEAQRAGILNSLDDQTRDAVLLRLDEMDESVQAGGDIY